MKKKKNNNVIFFILIVIILTALFFSSYKIINWSLENKETKKLELELKDIFKDENLFFIENKWINVSLPNMDKLKEINKDTVGYIKINETNVNYPVVKYLDNDYYINHNFYKNKNSAGAIFLDYRNNIDVLDKNTIIYGHNRKDGSMFQSLFNLTEENWYLNNDPYVYLTMKDNLYVFKIFSVYKIDTEDYYLTISFENDEKFKLFLDTIKKRSIIFFDENVLPNDKILTLSTCGDDLGKTRLVIHSKLIFAK